MPNDAFLLFGSETKGLDEALLKRNPDRCITLPMTGKGRSLNLAMSVAVVAYEAVRQNFDSFEAVSVPFRGE